MGSNGPTLVQGELIMTQVVKKLFDGERKLIYSFNFTIASTTAENYEIDVTDANKCALNSKGQQAAALTINRAWWSVNNSATTKPLKLFYEASADDLALTCNFADDQDWSTIGGLKNPRSSGFTGSIKVNFSSVTNDDTATLVLELIKDYS